MGFLKNLFSRNSKASRLHQEGMAKAQAGDVEGALAAYNAALKLPASHEVRTSTLYNRGLVNMKAGNLEEAQADFKAIMSDANASARVRDAARDSLHRLRKRHSISE